jgi:hypothetical protein
VLVGYGVACEGCAGGCCWLGCWCWDDEGGGGGHCIAVSLLGHFLLIDFSSWVCRSLQLLMGWVLEVRVGVAQVGCSVLLGDAWHRWVHLKVQVLIDGQRTMSLMMLMLMSAECDRSRKCAGLYLFIHVSISNSPDELITRQHHHGNTAFCGGSANPSASFRLE